MAIAKSAPRRPSAAFSPFDVDNYRDFMRQRVASSSAPRGSKSRLAEAIGCRLSYLSQIVAGKADLSVEQAFACAEHFGMDGDERSFLLLLVQRERAGTSGLRHYFSDKLAQARHQRLKVTSRVEAGMPLSANQQAVYYSSWEYSAVHVATSLKAPRTPDAIGRRLGLSPARVREILDFLERNGFVAAHNGDYRITTLRVHLSDESPQIGIHHSNWRMQAVRKAQRKRPDDLFYSSTVTLSKDDFLRIREDLLQAIVAVKARVRDSAEETIACFNVDVFELEA